MSVTVANSRFITSSLPAAFYQQLLSRISDFRELGKKVVREAECATNFRNTDLLEELAIVLSNIPIREYQLIGQYYLGVKAYLKGESKQSVFEEIVEKSQTYKAQAFLGLAALEARKGDYTAELKFLVQSLRYANTPSIALESIRGIAIVKAKEGFHQHSLKDFERMFPWIKYGNAHSYFQYLNSYAVELGEVGRIEEAQNVCKIVLASPYTNTYPEWRETGQDLALRGYKSRSSAPIIRKIPVVRRVPGKVLYMSERERSEGHRRSPFDQPRGVSILAEWKKKMVKEKGKEPNGKENGEQTNTDEMSDKDLLFEIMNIASEDNITREQLQEILDAARRIVSKKP